MVLYQTLLQYVIFCFFNTNLYVPTISVALYGANKWKVSKFSSASFASVDRVTIHVYLVYDDTYTLFLCSNFLPQMP